LKTALAVRRRARNRLKLLGLAAVAMLPLAAALVLYYAAPGLADGASANNGALLNPPASLAELRLTTPDGRRVEAGPERRWRVILLLPPGCDPACREDLQLLRRVHARLGPDRDRVRRVLALAAGVEEARVALRREYPHLTFAHAPAELLATLREGRELRGGAPEAHSGTQTRGVLVADPLGNVMLLYAREQIGEPLFDDLERLLRLSNIG